MQDYEAIIPEPETTGREYHQYEAERAHDPHFCIEEEPGADDEPIPQVSEPDPP